MNLPIAIVLAATILGGSMVLSNMTTRYVIHPSG